MLGLKWEDCDFEKREITINKTIHYSKASSPVEGSKFFYTTAKTMSSNRVIPMTDEVYEILQNQKIKQTEQKMWKRSIWKQHKEFQNLVFTCSDGSPVYYYNVNSAIKDYVAKINVIEIELAKEENKARLETLDQLPDSCAASAKRLQQQRGIFEQHNVFSPSMIDGIIKKLVSYNDTTLREDLKNDPEGMLELVNRYFHCG